MESFFLKYEMKYRQKKLLDESRRIQMNRVRVDTKVSLFRRSVLILSEVLSAMGVHTIK